MSRFRFLSSRSACASFCSACARTRQMSTLRPPVHCEGVFIANDQGVSRVKTEHLSSLPARLCVTESALRLERRDEQGQEEALGDSVTRSNGRSFRHTQPGAISESRRPYACVGSGRSVPVASLFAIGRPWHRRHRRAAESLLGSQPTALRRRPHGIRACPSLAAR